MSLADIERKARARVTPAAGYAGEVTAEEAWQLLSEDESAVLVDVRTAPEWSFVGIPDLAPLGREVVLVPWQVFPTMAQNPQFAVQLAEKGVSGERRVVFLCRSGARSRAAAIAMTQAGFEHCYNLTDGFEGPLSDERHRGAQAGWKASRLPWAQS